MDNKLGLTDEQLKALGIKIDEVQPNINKTSEGLQNGRNVVPMSEQKSSVEAKEVKTINPEVIKPSLDSWAEQSEKLLRKQNSPYRIIKGNSFLFFKIISILALLIIIVASGTFLYLMQDGKFQALVNTTLSCPNVAIPSCPTIPTCPTCPACPNLSCATNTTPQINLNLANLNCTSR